MINNDELLESLAREVKFSADIIIISLFKFKLQTR